MQMIRARIMHSLYSAITPDTSSEAILLWLAASDWKSTSLPAKRAEAGAQDLIPIHLIPRDKYIYRAREREEMGGTREECERCEEFSLQWVAWNWKTTNEKKKGISRAAHAAAPGPHAMNHSGHCAPRITPPTPRIFPNCSLVARRTPAALTVAASVRKKMLLAYMTIRESENFSRARAGFPDSAKP